MNRYTRILVSVCLFGCAVQAFAKTVTVVSAPWAGLTAADGSGVYFDVMREALATENIELLVRVSNWKRAKQMFYAGRADILLADYADTHPRHLYPHWHIDMDPPVLLFTRSPLTSLRTLSGKTVGWRLGYDFDVLLPVPVVGIEVADEEIGFELLQHGRLDGFVGYQHNMPAKFASVLTSQPLTTARKLYPVLQQDFASRQLAAAFDRGMQRLYDSGRLQQLFGERYVAASFPAAGR